MGQVLRFDDSNQRQAVAKGRVGRVGQGGIERDLLRATPLLDYDHPDITRLFEQRGWDALERDARIQQVYEFVRDEIRFGYSRHERIPASQVLREGFGHCNTKATLLMALLRRAGFRCRLHVGRVRKSLHSGLIPASLYRRLPTAVEQSWVEIEHRERWLGLEGAILDTELLARVQEHWSFWDGPFCGFAIATDALQHPRNDWNGGDTLIQRAALTADLGHYDDPDAFYARHPSNPLGIGALAWRWWYSRAANRRVAQVRAGCIPRRAITPYMLDGAVESAAIGSTRTPAA
jgi:hypothetical protein